MANDEFTGEEIEQLKLALYEAVFTPLFFAHLVAKLPGDFDDPLVQGLKTGMATQGLVSLPKSLLERFPVLRKVMWDQRYARRTRKHFMLEKVKGNGALPEDLINLIPGLDLRQFSRDAYGEAAAEALEAMKKLVQEIPRDDIDPHLHIYTDGGCSGNPGPGGVGVVWIYGDTRDVHEHWEAAGHKTTNSYVELLAVQRALSMLSDEERQKAITLHTDSQYVYNMLVKNYRAKANQELIAEIFGLMQGLSIEILKVPGHEKVWANERADKLATQGVHEARRKWQTFSG
jgi:ribonuclease HI